MIRLGKDKTLDNYFINENGVITDQFGNVQELKIHNGREYFKSVKVHMIQMWTNYGWRDGYKWNIHHLDENKLNNSLDNLVFLTRSEHSKLHKLGKHISDETKVKMSASRKGKQNHLGHHHTEETKTKISTANKGKHLSKETKAKMSASRKGKNNWSRGRIWVNNGNISKCVHLNEIPEGFVKGRL